MAMNDASSMASTNSLIDYEALNQIIHNQLDVSSTSDTTLPIVQQIDSQLIEVLDLDDSTDSNIIVKQLQIKGRQGLSNVKDDIAPIIYAEQITGKSQLLNILKQYFEQQWKSIEEEWFQTFLSEQKQNSSELYEEILTRTADYGLKYMKESPTLSLVIQFIFDFDDDTLKDVEIFDKIWINLISFGCKGLEKFTDYLAPAVMEEQVTNTASPLRMALKTHYREPLKVLLNENKIKNLRNLTDFALNCMTREGWWNGLHDRSVRDLIATNRFNSLMNNLKTYLTKNNLLMPDDAITTNSSQPSHLHPELHPSSQIITTTTESTVPTILNTSFGASLPSQTTSESYVRSSFSSNYIQPDELHDMSTTSASVNLRHTIISSPSYNDSMYLEEKNSLPPSQLLARNIVSANNPSERLFAQEQRAEPRAVVSQDRSAEIRLVLSCVVNDQKKSLSNLVQAGELLYAGQTCNEILTKIINGFRATNNFSSLVEACLQPIMYLLKRYQNLDDLMEALSSKFIEMVGINVWEESRLSMRMLIHILLLNSDLALSRMIMCLLCERNPVPFIEPAIIQVKQQQQQQISYSIIPEIIHVWNCDVPIVLSFGIGPCKGKSTLLNTVFMSTFEQPSPSIYFQQTIDIDFGYSFRPRRTLNIADSHGELSESLFYKIHELFAGFLMHVDYKYLKENNEAVLSFLRILPTHKFSLLIIRDVPADCTNQCSTILQNYVVSQSFKTLSLPYIADHNNTQNKRLIRTVRDLIFNESLFLSSHDKAVVKTVLMNLVSDDYKEHLKNMNDRIGKLKQKLIQLAEDNSRLAEFYPEYANFVELCKAQQRLQKFNFSGEDDDVIDEIRQKIFQLRQNQGKISGSSGVIFELFIDVLNSPNMLMCMNILGRDLKVERTRFVSNGDLANQLPTERSFSLELLWRNAILCSQYQTEDLRKLILYKYLEYVEAGLPFEIIDGDNYHFPHPFLIKVLSSDSTSYFANKKVLVISVIGPQNSGKSTLLNYMFGTFFDVRDGRCTRGIYGSFMKSNRNEFDYIMLIDTEGLLGVERDDKEFDRRLVLFCLAVSHLVIVNMVGEVNESLKTMLTLCADSLREMGVSRVPQPIVHFVLNQRADLDIRNNQAAIDRIMSDLRSFNLSGMIDITPETFHTLPNAFKKERGPLNDATLPCLIKTEPEFIELVQLLCRKIIDSATRSIFRSSEQFWDPTYWLNSAITIFHTLQKFADLTYYRDINERRQDSEVREYISTKLGQEFSSRYREQFMIASLNKNEREIEEMLLPEMDKKQTDLDNELINRLQLLKASDTIRTRSRQFLRVQIIETFNALRTECQMVSERARVQLLVQHGEGDLRKTINDIIAKGIIMSEKEASQKFDDVFDTIIGHIRQNFNPTERRKIALKHIYTEYQVYEKHAMPDYQNYILNHLSWLEKFQNNDIKENYILNDLCVRFTTIAYKYTLVEENPFTSDLTNPYSFDMINSLTHLNKDLIKQRFGQFLKSHSISEPSKKFKTIRQHVTQLFSMNFTDAKEEKYAVVCDEFLYGTRQEIQREWKKLPEDRTIAYKEEHLYLHVEASKLIQRIIDLIVDATRGYETNDTRQIHSDIIQRIVGLINTLIKEVNLELKSFCLALNRPFKSILHTCAIILLTKYYYNEQQTHFSQTLKTLNDRKQDLKSYFISMVVMNTSNDDNSAISLCRRVKDCILNCLTVEGQRQIQTDLEQYEFLNRKWIQDRCDGKLLTTTDRQWYMDYIENPTKVVLNYFNEMWEDIHRTINQHLTTLKNSHNETLSNFFYCMQGLHDAIKDKGRALHLANEIFQLHGENSLNANQNFNNKKRCMGILLFNYLCGAGIPTVYTCSNNDYILTTDAQQTFALVSKQYQPIDKLIAITEIMVTEYDSFSVVNLAIFLQQILEKKSKIIGEFREERYDFTKVDAHNTYAVLLDKIRGCPDRCPCCQRPCDADHSRIKSNAGSEDNKHCCATGHALRAMNGYKFEETEEASLFMCEQIQNDQVIVVGPQRKKWSEFKLDHCDWIFDSLLDDEKLNQLHNKFLTIWANIGPELCQRYSMRYVTHNSTRNRSVEESFHYVLMLDSSGSMEGQPWRDLLNAVNEFLQRRRNLRTNDRITVIKFTTRATVAYFNEEINNINVGTITYVGGGTDFKSAFAQVDQCIARSKTVDSKFAIIFMSDGQASYPEAELNILNESHGPVLKRFWTLALGRNQISVLNRINERMNGRYYNALESSQLIEAYAEIARTS